MVPCEWLQEPDPLSTSFHVYCLPPNHTQCCLGYSPALIWPAYGSQQDPYLLLLRTTSGCGTPKCLSTPPNMTMLVTCLIRAFLAQALAPRRNSDWLASLCFDRWVHRIPLESAHPV